jgi:membrane-bound serine protease (ClpP class)
MRAKIESYLTARVRSITEGQGYRGQVLTAMIRRDYVLEIDGEVLKPEGDLLTLTASEAMREFGDPPVPLLGAGISTSLEALMDKLHGAGNYTVTRLEVTWSERLAQYINTFSPILMAIGLVMLFVEFKTPGFGFFGLGGAAVMLLVFFGHFTAGLSGHEAALLFVIGLLLVAVEIFILPGTIVFALTGALLMLGALAWSMVDYWPSEPLDISADMFAGPLINVAVGVILALVIFFLIIRFLPRGGLWGRMVLEAAVGGEPGGTRPLFSPAMDGEAADTLVGQLGMAVTALYPSGQVEVGGRRYEASLVVGFAEAGTTVRVRRRREFGLEVEVVTP